MRGEDLIDILPNILNSFPGLALVGYLLHLSLVCPFCLVGRLFMTLSLHAGTTHAKIWPDSQNIKLRGGRLVYDCCLCKNQHCNKYVLSFLTLPS
jgi:hypothetical protein